MSRVGRMPILVPSDVEVTITGSRVSVRGPKGELNYSFNSGMGVSLEGSNLVVTRSSDDKQQRSLHGLTRSLLANMVLGVTKGFEKTLEIVGVGYRVVKEGDRVIIRVGHSHPDEISPLPGVSLTVEGASRIKVSGIDKQVVGEMAARIRAIRPPDAYKGKGVRYAGEQIHLKPGKAGRAVGGLVS